MLWPSQGAKRDGTYTRLVTAYRTLRDCACGPLQRTAGLEPGRSSPVSHFLSLPPLPRARQVAPGVRQAVFTGRRGGTARQPLTALV